MAILMDLLKKIFVLCCSGWKFFSSGPIVNILGFVSYRVSVTTANLCSCKKQPQMIDK